MSGFSAWLVQRLSAIYLTLFIIVAIFWALTTDVDYKIWQSGFQNTWVKLAVLLFALSLLIHAWIGLRDVIVDYIHPIGLRLIMMTLLVLFLLANGFWLLSILLLTPWGGIN